MYIKQDMDFGDLMENCWSGAIDTLKTIEEHDKEKELMALLEEMWMEEVPTLTAINDYLWFEPETVFDCLGIFENEEEEEIDYEEGETEQETNDFDEFCGMFNKCEKCPYDNYCKTLTDCRNRYSDLKAKEEDEE